MNELSFERMEEIQGGLSWGCAFATGGLVLAFGAIATSTGGAGVALAWEAAAWMATTGGWAYSCAYELGLY